MNTLRHTNTTLYDTAITESRREKERERERKGKGEIEKKDKDVCEAMRVCQLFVTLKIGGSKLIARVKDAVGFFLHFKRERSVEAVRNYILAAFY